MKPWIQNVSMDDIIKGLHYDPGEDSVLIQIVDPGMSFPRPKYAFSEVYQFNFYDAEPNSPLQNKFTMSDAREIYEILQKSFDNSRNVTVHCIAGLCRSGAVAEFGVDFIGFTDTETFKLPNTLVRKFLIKVLQEQND